MAIRIPHSRNCEKTGTSEGLWDSVIFGGGGAVGGGKFLLE